MGGFGSGGMCSEADRTTNMPRVRVSRRSGWITGCGTFDTACLEDGNAPNSSHSWRAASGPIDAQKPLRPTALAFLELNHSLSREAMSPADICRCSRLLHLMVHSVYFDRELFVREVVPKPSRPGWLRSPSHPTRCLCPARLERELALRGFPSAAAKPGSSNPAIPESVRSPTRA